MPSSYNPEFFKKKDLQLPCRDQTRNPVPAPQRPGHARFYKLRKPWLGMKMAVLIPLGICALPSTANAQTSYTWDGTGALSNNWGYAAFGDTNWTVAGVPAVSPTVNGDITFQGSTGLIPNVDSNYIVNSVNFAAGASAFTVRGGLLPSETLTINGGGIVNNSGSAQSFANTLNNIALGASQTWNAGTTSGGSLSVASAVNMGTSRVLTIDGSNNTTISGVISGTGSSLVKTGTGTLNITGANTFTGGINVNQGTMLWNTTGTTLLPANTPVTVAAGATLQVNSTNPSPIKNNAIDLTLNGGTYAQGGGTGNTGAWVRNMNLTPGSLVTTNSTTGSYNSENLGVYGTVTMTGTGTANISLQNGMALANGGTSTFNIGTGSNLISSTPFRNYDGVAATTTGLLKTGDGTLTFTSTALSTYTGPTTITGGTLSIAQIANGGAASNLGSSSNAASNLVFNGGTLEYTGASASSDRNFTINAGTTATIDVDDSGAILSLAGATGTATTGSLTKVGDGTLKLTGTQTYTGNTVVNAGTLLLGASNVLSNSSNVILNGGKLDTGGFSDTAGTLLLSSSSVIDMNNASSALSFANSSGTGTWGGILSIFNWPFNGSTVRFGTNTTGLTSTQLSNIRVYTGPDGSSPYWTPTLDANGYLVVVPEPGAVLATLFMLAGIGWRERAQFIRIRRAR